MQDVHKHLVDAARAELEAAGNPAYLVALVDEHGQPHWSPIIFSAARAAREQAARLEPNRRPGQQIAVVARQVEGRRALFTVFDETVERGLHRQLEVVEASFAERDLPA